MFNHFHFKYLFFIGLCFFSSLAMAQLSFEARVNKTKISEFERLKIEFVANFDGDFFQAPDFDYFDVLGPSTSISQSWINGRSSFNKSYIYILEPSKTGKFTIGSATIDYKGQKYKTKPITIEVYKGDPNQNQYGQQNQNRQPNQIDVNDEIHLIAEINKTNPYVNEPITVVYKMHIGNRILGIQSFEELNKPKYNDFWSHHFEIKAFNAVNDSYNGKNTKSVVLKKVVLYPQKNGNLEIEPLSFKLNIQVATGRRDFFGRPEVNDIDKVVSAGKKTITVKALPTVNQPEDFSGAVGNFTFNVIPSRTVLKAGESMELKVQVSGTGNLKLFKLPELKLPNAFEVYDPINKQNINTPPSGMTGNTTDSYTIIPQTKGNYNIKPISFSYFDINSKTYKTITSQEFEIVVTDGDGQIAKNDEKTNDNGKTKIIAAEHFKFINTKTDLTDTSKSDFLGSVGHWTAILFSLSFIPLAIFIKRKRADVAADIIGNRMKTNQRLAQKYLKEAQKTLHLKDQFYDALERSLHKYLKAKLHIETAEMSKERISDLLSQKQFNELDVKNYITLLESCEFARYAPSTETKMHEDYELAVTTIANIEKTTA